VRGSTSCKQCPRGQFCGKPNCVSCDSCTVDQYQDEEGQSQCEICPPNTVAQTRGSVTVESCLCKEGYYRRDRLVRQPKVALCSPLPALLVMVVSLDL
jgi:CUB/sushi domain-containing protein